MKLEICDDSLELVFVQSPWLIWPLGEVCQVIGWTVIGGGISQSRHVVWRQVRNNELAPPVCAESYLLEKLEQDRIPVGPTFLTSADINLFASREVTYKIPGESGSILACAVVTAGLGNALCIGDFPGPTARIGTINIAVKVNQVLSFPAQLELISLIAEARTAAVLSFGYKSSVSQSVATGTGTDCIVLASKVLDEKKLTKEPEVYAGKHTPIGYVVGKAVYEGATQAIKNWMISMIQIKV